MNTAPIGTTPRSTSGIEPLSAQDCETFLASMTVVGRVAFQSSDGLQLLPVNYAYRSGCVYFRTAADGVLAELADGCSEVVFEIDRADELTHQGWSVVVRGKARGVDDADVDLSPRGPQPWAADRRDVLIEVTPNQISGRRIRIPRQRPAS